MAKLTRFETKQTLRVELAEAWAFFSDPRNLVKITPSYMGFEIHTPLPEKAYAGLVIEYTVRPIMGIPLRWVTEITHLDEGKMFVDEQRFGPYSFWHHQHLFNEIEGGIEMRDIVHYRAPFGPIGQIAQALLIDRQVQQIFAHRFKVLEETFHNR